MTDKKELSRGDARARVAVLEAEKAGRQQAVPSACPQCLGKGSYPGVYGNHACNCSAPVERVEQEPYAWTLTYPDGRVTLEPVFPHWALDGSGGEENDGYTVNPLYTTPQLAAPAPDVAGLVEALKQWEPRLLEKVSYATDESDDTRSYAVEVFIRTPAANPEPFEIAAEKWIRAALAAHQQREVE